MKFYQMSQRRYRCLLWINAFLCLASHLRACARLCQRKCYFVSTSIRYEPALSGRVFVFRFAASRLRVGVRRTTEVSMPAAKRLYFVGERGG